MRPDADLLQAYLDARYFVDLPDGSAVQILIGHPTPALDGSLIDANFCWALLNPGNGHSAPWPDRLNGHRMACLVKLLRQRGLSACAAHSHADDGGFSERGVLITCIGLRQLDALACRFGQHAVVIGGAQRPAALRFFGRGWRHLGGGRVDALTA